MSTRGAVGFRFNNEYIVAYNSHDSYPSGLGKEVACMVNLLQIKDLDEVRKILSKVIVNYDESDVLPIRNIHDILLGRERTFFAVDSSFIKGDLSCSWAYIINLDDGLFEVWKGDQKVPQKGNPLGKEKRMRHNLYPCARVLTTSLNKVPEKWESILQSYAKNFMENKILPYNKTPICLTLEEEMVKFINKNIVDMDSIIESKKRVDKEELKKIRNSLKKFLKKF